MKKLGKLSINVDKIMKNEELVNLRGGEGYYDGDLACMMYSDETNYPGSFVCCVRVTRYSECDKYKETYPLITNSTAAACPSSEFC